MPDSLLPATMLPDSTTHLVHAAMQFAAAVRRRWRVVAAVLLAAALLGALYYATSERIYSAKAELLILQTGENSLSPTIEVQSNRDDSLMPTFVNLISSAKVLQGALKRLAPEDIAVDLSPDSPEQWIKQLQMRLSAAAVYKTNIITVTYESKDPSAAVRVVNAVVDSYLEFMRETHQGTAAEIVQTLNKEKDDLSVRLSEKEQQLQDLSRSLGALDSGGSGQLLHPLVERAKAFNASLIEAQKERVELAASLAALQAAIRNGEDLRQYLNTMSDAVGREMLLNSLGFNPQDATARAEAERRILEDQVALNALREHLGDNHPRVQQLLQRIAANQMYLQGFQQRLRDRLNTIEADELGPTLLALMRQRLAECVEKENSLAEQYEIARVEAGQLAGGLAQMEMLKNDIAGLRELYGGLVKRLTNIELTRDLRASLITEPVENRTPVSPSLSRTVAMVMLLGLGLGLLIVYVLDVMDDHFRSVEEIQWQLKTPVLTVVREMAARSGSGAAAIEVAQDPTGAASESFRTLRTAIALHDERTERIIVTSAEPGDGKSTVAVNLAAAFAQSGKRTLLIDGDLRRPGLSTLLGLRGREGLSEVLRAESPAAESAPSRIRRDVIPGLDVLPCGARPVNPAELLASARMSELLTWTESTYDQVIIDTPPAPLASDTIILGRMADGALLVTQPLKNTRRTLFRAIEHLRILKVPLIGLAVNRLPGDEQARYAGYSGDYYGAEAEETLPMPPTETDAEGGADTAARPIAAEEAPTEASTPVRGRIVPRRVA
ncbi:polysaccharide biosynthesis tyrosine autokinase [Thermopirellula anaerolimosa]